MPVSTLSPFARHMSKALAPCLILGLAACGDDTTKNKSCVLSYELTQEKESGENLELSYRSAMTTECKAVYSDNSGRSTITLAVTSKALEGGYVDALKVGEKSFTFGKDYSLKNGNVQSSFSSDTKQDWAFPWVDSPSTASVTIVIPKATEKTNRPTAITTEFAAGAK
jgi:hypothetical protein